ncbi:hypothetical protein CDAR_249691 [Caerostris darwini]|uniref:Uncharacterized protein n=1 Tax=Caerostris darwini TaxID=1538125 RepID=A0AAV4SDY5_9ARAC|nr:hypothetical protein CDAR_249691 [Caerostris darwini]
MVKGTPLRGERLLPAPGAFFLAARKTKGGSLWTPQHTPQARQRKGGPSPTGGRGAKNAGASPAEGFQVKPEAIEKKRGLLPLVMQTESSW